MTSSILTPLDTKKLDIINTYFNNMEERDINIIISILNPKIKLSIIKNKISLRFLEWFVLNYSMNHNIIINKLTGEEIHNNINLINEYTIDSNIINIYENYKLQTKIHTKEYFDPFKRQKRIEYIFLKNHYKTITTIAQLNFFKWIFENGIIKYIILNYDKLHKSFKAFSGIDRKNKEIRRIKKQTDKLSAKTQEIYETDSISSISVSPNSLSLTV